MSTDELNISLHCPICRGTSFSDIDGRPDECSGCRSKSRERALAIALISSGVFDDDDAKVLHVGPGRGLAVLLRRRCKPERVVRVGQSGADAVDQTLAEVALESGFSCIVHTHILQQLSAEPRDVIRQLDALLRPGGVHAFTVPIRGKFGEGSAGAGRVLGSVDFVETLQDTWGSQVVTFPLGKRFSPQDLERYGLRADAPSRIGSHSVFMHRRG